MEYISTVKGEGGGLSDTLVSDFRMNPSFRLRPTGFNNAEGLSSLTWSNIARCYSSSDQFNCSTRRNGVDYSSPDLKGIFEGFNVQWGWFEDDDWGAALRYKNSFSLWGEAPALPRTIHGCSPPTSPMRISATSACRWLAAAGKRNCSDSAVDSADRQQADLLPARLRRVGRFDRRSSTSRAACSPWAISARPNPATPMSDGFYTGDQRAGHERLGRSGRHSEEILGAG